MKSAVKPSRRSAAWYALRRTLPPWSFEKNLRELVQCLPRYRVDELIVKVDTEEFTHGQPRLEWVKAYQEKLFRIRRAMERIGVRYSLNPWITVGHNDRGRNDLGYLPGLRTVVGHDGTECTCCACPLSSIWREHVAKVWTLYAETRPHVIWVEDDIRTFNHNPVRYGCFCSEHLARFSERVRREVSREELVQALTAPGKPHPWRAEFFDMQAEIMIDTVAFLGRTVHRSSPETCLGLMSSGPLVHCLEGRRWKEFAQAMADGQPVYSRPPMGNYHEDSLRGLYYSHDSIKITRHCMPTGAIEQTEVENVPFTAYSKSTVFTFLEMAISFAYGSHGVTMNLFDHCGTPMENDAALGRMLGEKKAWLEALARRCQTPGSYRGVRLLYHEKASYHKVLRPGAQWYELVADGAAMMQALEALGIPTTYEDSPVVAAAGQTLRAFSDDEIRAFLSGGLLLDATAASVLFERGFGVELGLRSIAEPRFLDDLGAFSAEEVFSRQFGGADKRFLTLTVPHLAGRPNFSVMEPVEEAHVISRIVDPDTVRHHVAMYAYENTMGGRVAVHAFDLASALGPAFYHPHRLMQFQSTVRWLSRGRPPVLVWGGGAYPLAFRKDIEGRTILGLFNLTLDPWDGVAFEVADTRRIETVEVLSQQARWRKHRAVNWRRSRGVWAIGFDDRVSFEMPLVLTVYWRRD